MIKTKIGQLGKAVGSAFTPRANIPRSDVQSAVEYVMDNAENVGTPYAPTDAEYLTNGTVSGLSNERAVTDTSTISWDWGTTGQAKASLSHLGIEDLTDPAADRIMGWDDSDGRVIFFTPSNGLGTTGSNLSITDPDLAAIVNASFVAGDVLYHDGTTLARLPAGTSGQFLRTLGAGNAPDWQNITGGGDMLRANNLSDLTDHAAARQFLGVEIGVDVQAHDATLASLSGLGTAADKIAYTTGVDTWAETALTSFARSILDDADESTFKATVNLEIGTDVQAWSTHLDAIASLAKTDGNIIVANGTTFVAESGSTARASLGLTIGTHVQAWSANLDAWSALATSSKQDADATLTALAGVTTSADKVIYATGADAFSTTDLTGFARTLLDDSDASTARSTLGLVIGTHVQAYSSVLQNTTASFTTAQETKLGHISVTQAVDLDAIETRVNALDAAVVLKGTWDASTGSFPGSGTAQTGESWIVSVGGTIDGVAFVANDRILALVDNASTSTYTGNWHKLDYTDAVLSVAGKTGAVTLAASDISDSSANGRAILTAANYAAIRALLDLEIGTDVQAYSARLGEIAALAVTDGNIIVGNGAAWVAESGATARASLGLGTGDTPQFTGIEVGHASDTTITRASAGVIAVEGSNVLMASNIGSTVQAYDAFLDDIAALTDPNADRVMFWDDSAGEIVWGTPSNGIEFSNTTLQMAAAQRTREIVFVIDGGGSAISTGQKGHIRIPFACTITAASVFADQTGSIVVDIWKDSYANFPPLDADSITASAPVTLSSAQKNNDTTLTGWTTSIAAGDVLAYNVDSATTVTRATVTLTVTVT